MTTNMLDLLDKELIKDFLIITKQTKKINNDDELLKKINILDKKYHFRKELMTLTPPQLKELSFELQKDIIQATKNQSLIVPGYLNILIRVYQSKNKQQTLIKPTPFPKKEIPIISFNELQTFEDKTFYYINKMFSGNSVNMIYSPPAQSKSIISLLMAISIAGGTYFMKQKTNQAGVLYIDKENNSDVIKQRAMALCDGQKLPMKDLPLYFLIREGELSIDYRERLEPIIKEKNIKVIFLDTIRRFGSFDENSSNDINEIYQDFFTPLMEDFGICFIFLHHTTKEGKYRGSGDLEAQVNVAYEIKKKQRKDSEFTIKATKTRGNEEEIITGYMSFENIVFDEDTEKLVSINIERIEKAATGEKEQNYGTIKQCLDDNLEKEKEYKFSEVLSIVEYNGICKKTKLAYYLKWAVEKGIMYKDEDSKIYKILDKKNIVKIQTNVKDYIFTKFKKADIVDVTELIELYDQNIIEDTISKLVKDGLIYEPRKGELKQTENGSIDVENFNLTEEES